MPSGLREGNSGLRDNPSGSEMNHRGSEMILRSSEVILRGSELIKRYSERKVNPSKENYFTKIYSIYVINPCNNNNLSLMIAPSMKHSVGDFSF